MMIDSSAIVALLFGEAEAPVFLDALTSSGPKSMSVFTRLESAIVVEAWKGEPGARALSRLLVEAEVEIIAFDSGQAEVALDAQRRYGKGRHAAGLKIGDCVSYALATIANDSLLFKGSDFAATDVAPAVELGETR